MNNRNLNINQSQVFPTASQINRPQQQTLTNFRHNIITCAAQICFLLMIATAMYLFVFAIKQLG